MLDTTVLCPSTAPVPTHVGSPVVVPTGEEDTTARELADAVAEFDAALADGRPMFVLARLDREVTAAGRRHRAAVAASTPA